MNRPPYGNDLKVLNNHLEMLKVHAQTVANMTVKVNAGTVWMNEVSPVEFVGGSSPEITAPVTGAKWVLICLDNTSRIQVVEGVASSAPLFPQPPYLYVPLAGIFVQSGTVRITEDMIYDLRPFFSVGNRNLSHTVLTNRVDADAHPISAITDLTNQLTNRPTLTELNNLLTTKADQDGTNSNVFRINKDYAGVPSETCSLVVERGAAADVSLRWNEELTAWEMTNDGTNFATISSGGLEQHTHTSNASGGFLPANCINSGNLLASVMPLYGDWPTTSNITMVLATADTNLVRDMLVLKHTSTNTTDSGFGAGLFFKLDSSTAAEREAGFIRVSWNNATDVERISQMVFAVYDYNNVREAIIISADGSGPKLGFFGVAPVPRPSAYTQVYNTADKTLSEYIQDSKPLPFTGLDNQQPNQVYAQLDDLNALRIAYENLRLFAEDAVQVLNSLIDDLQNMGVLQ